MMSQLFLGIGDVWADAQAGSLFAPNRVFRFRAEPHRKAARLISGPRGVLSRSEKRGWKACFNRLNGLFRRVEQPREHERSFTAFAAHERMTPLAGLKTQVEIGLRKSEEGIVFSVTDRRPGIVEADRPHVTERFFRSPASKGTAVSWG